MSDKTSAILSAALTFILLIVTGVLLFAGQIIALNGVINESQAFTSLGIGAVCQCVVLFLAAGFAGWFCNILIFRFDWNKPLAVIVAAILGTLLGAVVSFISIVISIPLAGIQ